VGAPLLGGIGALAVALASCGSTTVNSDASPVPAGLPAAQALPGSGGTWATLAMGRSGDPLNTFGELFYRSACGDGGAGSGAGCGGGPRWALATPPGVASNGGIMVAANPDGGLTAGFGVSLDLRFSPLAETSDAGAAWSGGILPVALAAATDALAAAGPVLRLALAAAAPVGHGGVLSTRNGGSTWSRMATTGAVATAASGQGCTLRALTAVAITATVAGTAAGDALVAGDCIGGNRAGVFRIGTDGRPSPAAAVGPRVAAAASDPIRVLRLVASPTGLSTLVAVGSGGGGRLVTATTADGGSTWAVSTPFATGRPVTATSVTPAGGFVVLLGGEQRGAAVVSTPGGAWRTLPDPPVGTAVIAATPEGSLDALVPSGVTLDVDSLAAGGWARVQQLDVPIQYGSTSAGGGSG
jgi:hypothetical protein